MSSLSVVIPNYNGRDLLMRYLPLVEKAVGRGTEIVVVDDASTDDSVYLLWESFPHVQVVSRSTNGGFSKAVNDGIRATSGEFILLLNSDVQVTTGFLNTIIPLFDDNNVFSVSPAVILPRIDDIDEGAKTGKWHHGMFFAGQRQGVQNIMPILYATGCAAVYRRKMLDNLNGFDEAFSPFYYEDADLGYRAWKRGWKSIYQPGSTVYHQHAASISRKPGGLVGRVKARNSLLFVWRNLEDQAMLRRHRLWLPLVIARRSAVGDYSFLQGWRDAYHRRGEAAVAKSTDSPNRRLSDVEIFRMTGTAGS